ncbi:MULTISPECIES: T9SS type A sorting domain-containing protein [Mesonia]|uniref:Uncharacterized protein n=1 Tax=Mesonia oceanica TaxID=2687242 RepID=A0AC61Y3M2_9FLAO|nr:MULTISPECIES: T9SS type A sorting domain-containing protein [Mesonia]MAN28268.1 hypothetical protein [Mesonia sp.]MAQ41475.1 hypothetical protein [Mesonia sp.]VVU99012.1 hypothetical protein FVB9532_00262 [Mesonia oceanica]|tara:strand:- start:638 stop:1507 length:870 start_codon:yes stop_codon:yes gene_type:complete
MRKIYTLLILVFAFTFSVNAQNLVITNVVDGSCGNTSKFVEIYVSGTVDLSNYKMVRRSNSGTWEDDGVDIALTDLGTKTDEFIYLIRDLATLNTEFPSANITTENSLVNDDISHNGDDSYRIMEISTEAVIDQFGGDIDGTGENWEYVDSWGSRNNDMGPNPTFTESEWTFYGVDVLDDQGICNESDALENTVTTIGTYTNTNLSAQKFKLENLSIYPNPVIGGKLYVQAPENSISNIKVYNLLGQKVLEQKINNASMFNVTSLHSGIYLASFETTAHQRITKKVIIK